MAASSLPLVLPQQAENKTELSGTLDETPLPQLLLTILTRAYSGSLVLRPEGGMEIACFVNGRMTHIAPAEPRLNPRDALVAIGVAAADVADDRVPVEVFDWVRRAQVLAWVRATTAAPCVYEFHSGQNLLEGRTTIEASACDPLEVIVASARCVRDEPRLEAGLDRLEGLPIRLHERARPDRFGLTPVEQRVIARLSDGAATRVELRSVASERVLRPLLYALLFTRHLDLGVGASPADVASGVAQTPPNVRLGQRLVQLACDAGALTHYELLGVANSASVEEIRSACEALRLELAAEQLPDGDPLRPAAQRLSGRIVRAGETLIDRERRAQYDEVISRPLPTSESLRVSEPEPVAEPKKPRVTRPTPVVASPPARSRSKTPLLIVAALLVLLGGFVALRRVAPASAQEDLTMFGLELELRADGDTRPTDHELHLWSRGSKGAALVAQLLTETRRVEDGEGSYTQSSVQVVANKYLLRWAAHSNHEPPPLARDLAADVANGLPPGTARWEELRTVWLSWLAGHGP